TRPTSRFEFDLERADLQQLTDFERLPGLRFAGSANWHNVLEWPLGRFNEHRGEGRVTVEPPAGVTMMAPSPTWTDGDGGASADGAEQPDAEWGPFAPIALPAHLPIGGEASYQYGPDDVTFGPSRFVTERTHVTFEGTTAYGSASRLAFHVTSSDWQE